MKKHILFFLVFCFVISLTNAFTAEKPRLGVLRFTNRTSAGWWSVSVARDLQDMLASELASTKAFQVLERKEIGAVLNEQELSASGRVSKRTLVKMRKIKGARYLVAGTVSAYERNVSGSGGKVRVGPLSLGGKKEKTYIAVDLKVIDSETGEIVETRTIEANTKGGGIGVGVHKGILSVSGKTYKKTAVGKALRACIIYISEYLKCALVKGKDHKCMKKWNKMEEKRRKKTKGSIELE